MAGSNKKTFLENYLAKEKAAEEQSGPQDTLTLVDRLNKVAESLDDGKPKDKDLKGKSKKASESDGNGGDEAHDWDDYAPEFVKEATGFVKEYYVKIGNILEAIHDDNQEMLKTAEIEKVAKPIAKGLKALMAGGGALGIGAAGHQIGAGQMGKRKEKAKENFFNVGFDLGREAMLYELMSQMEEDAKGSPGGKRERKPPDTRVIGGTHEG